MAGRALWALVGLLVIGGGSGAQAQDAPRVGTGRAEVHQWGIVLSGSRELLDIPDFVHRPEGFLPESLRSDVPSRLDYSCLYFNPPPMLSGHLTLNVTMRLPGSVTAWYPYAHETSPTQQRVWNNVQMGVAADGLETTHPVWMKPRAVGAAAIKVYKPGPAGSQPDDEGTTEGDVYMFVRGYAQGCDALSVGTDALSGDWLIKRLDREEGAPAGLPVPFDETNRHAWLVQKGTDGEVIGRALMLDVSATGTVMGRSPRRVDTGTTDVTRTTLELRVQLNEALVGHGLRGDEAAAQTELVLEAVRKRDEPLLIYVMRKEWVERFFPLKVEGPAEEPVRVFVVLRTLPGDL